MRRFLIILVFCIWGRLIPLIQLYNLEQKVLLKRVEMLLYLTMIKDFINEIENPINDEQH